MTDTSQKNMEIKNPSPIYLFDTLTKEKREFIPQIKGALSMYSCGPTVYDYLHIGNLRSFLLSDIVRRVFEFNGYKVNQVMNVTDIGHLSSDADSGEDKMTKALIREGKELTLENMKDIAVFYTDVFKNDMNGLNILTPNTFPVASDHIKEDVDLISKLVEKGLTYSTKDGLYFETTKYPNYGKLGGIAKLDEAEMKSRLEANPEKKDPRDFALWKFNPTLGYEAPWGKGFPGWHIECSAMSMKYLGESFDIHTGGVDHIPVHHNNEIAQSESLTGKPLANYWLHGAFLTVRDSKMAKSSGTFITLKNLIEQGYSPLDYRYLLLTAHWSTSIDFTNDSLTAAAQARHRLVSQVSNLIEESAGHSEEVSPTPVISETPEVLKFTEIVNNNLDMPGALAYLWQFLKSDSISSVQKLATIEEFDKVFGLDLLDEADKLSRARSNIGDDAKEIAKQRDLARSSSDWKKSDELRDQLKSMGYEVFDSPVGTRISKKEV